MKSATFQPGYILDRVEIRFGSWGCLISPSYSQSVAKCGFPSAGVHQSLDHDSPSLRDLAPYLWFEEDLSRWKERLIIAPVIIFTLTILGAIYVPLTLFMVNVLWDHQHSIMQQHGFSRIYDFKSGTGTKRSGRFDLGFHWIFFGNMLITSPLFSTIWIAQFASMGLLPDTSTVQMIQSVSWGITISYGVVYLLQLIRVSVRDKKSIPSNMCSLGRAIFSGTFVRGMPPRYWSGGLLIASCTDFNI